MRSSHRNRPAQSRYPSHNTRKISRASRGSLLTLFIPFPLGYRPTNDKPTQIGAGIQIPPNAARVLAHLGVLSKTLTQSVRPQAIVLHSYSDGSPLHTLNIEPHAQNTYGFPLLVTHRANLCNILYQEALIQGVTVRFDCAVQQIDFSKAAVQVASGEIIDADVILATDGAHSVCREALLGHPHPPKPSGKLIYRVCIPSDTVRGYAELIDLIELPRIHIWLGPDVHVVCYGLEG